MVEPTILQDSKVLESGLGANGRLSIISEKGKGSKGASVPPSGFVWALKLLPASSSKGVPQDG